MSLVCAIDQGTSSSRVSVFSNGEVVAQAQQKHCTTAQCPVQMMQEIWELLEEVALQLRAKEISVGEIEFVAIANQRETAIAWNRRTGTPIHKAISWKEQDKGQEFLASLQGISECVYQKTGIPLSTTFSALKWKHILAAGEFEAVALGTVDTWILFNLTGGKSFLTDATNASRTMLMNIHTGKWDMCLCEAFGIPIEMLPEIVPTQQLSFGKICKGSFSGVTIGRMIGDQQASLYAHSAGGECGILKCTYGTGCFLMQNTGRKAVFADGLITTVAFQVENCLYYALEAYVAFGGAELDALVAKGEFGSTHEIDNLVAFPAHSESTMRKKEKATRLYKGLCELIAKQVALFQKALNMPFEFRVDGGLANSNSLMQMQADTLGFPVHRMRQTEATSLGAVGCLNQGKFDVFFPA